MKTRVKKRYRIANALLVSLFFLTIRVTSEYMPIVEPSYITDTKDINN